MEWDPTLATAVSQLSRRQRAVVALHYGQGYSLDEVAEILRCGRGTATGAAGAATHNINNCQPNCTEGTYTTFPVAVQLSNPGYLDGILVFQTITTLPIGNAGTPETSTATGLYGAWGWPSS